MRKFTVVLTLLLSSGFAFAQSPNFVVISQFADQISGSLAIQQAQVTQNIAGSNANPWVVLQQHAANISGGSLALQSASVNQTSIGPTSPFSTTPY